MAARLLTRVRHVAAQPVVAIRVWLRGGCLAETIAGVASVTGRSLVEGTSRRDWRSIAGDAEGRGMVLASFGSLEGHGLAIDAMEADWERALEWAAELILDSQFPDDRCDWVRCQTLAELESLADQPDVRTGWAFARQLYHPHPAARPVLGEARGLESLTALDCRAFHRDALSRGGLVAVAGRVEEDRVLARAEELFAPLQGDAAGDSTAPPPVGLSSRCEVAVPEHGSVGRQAHLYLGHLTVPRRHPDHRALELLAVILGSGSGLSGRIPTRLREEEGLAYSAHAHTVAGSGVTPGRLVVYLGTLPEQTRRAEAAAIEEIARLLEEGIRRQEVEDARTYLLRRDAFLRETSRQWGDLLAEALFYQQPVDRADWVREQLLAIDHAAVEAAARRHLRPDAVKVTLGLPQAGSSPAAES